MLKEGAESWGQSAELLLLRWGLGRFPAYATDSLDKAGHFWG